MHGRHDIRTGGAHTGQMSLPAGLSTALNAVTEILNQRIRQLGQRELHLRVMPYASRGGRIFWVARPLDVV